jgi:hypothetical protein
MTVLAIGSEALALNLIDLLSMTADLEHADRESLRVLRGSTGSPLSQHPRVQQREIAPLPLSAASPAHRLARHNPP